MLSPGAVAKLFGVDPRTVTRWVDKGMLAAILTPGGHRRYRYLDVMALRDRLSGAPAATASGSAPPASAAVLTPSTPSAADQTVGFGASASSFRAVASPVTAQLPEGSAGPAQAQAEDGAPTVPQQQPPQH